MHQICLEALDSREDTPGSLISALAHLVLGLHPSLQLLYRLAGCFFLSRLDRLCSHLGLQLCHLHTCSSVVLPSSGTRRAW